MSEKKNEKQAARRAAADGYRATLAGVEAAEQGLAAARAAQTPAIEALVKECGNTVKLKINGTEVMAKFRKAHGGPETGYLVSHEALDGESI